MTFFPPGQKRALEQAVAASKSVMLHPTYSHDVFRRTRSLYMQLQREAEWARRTDASAEYMARLQSDLERARRLLFEVAGVVTMEGGVAVRLSETFPDQVALET